METIIKKAYCLNLEKISNSLHANEVIVRTDKLSTAKQLILKEVRYDDYLTLSAEELNYLNVPVKRAKSMDIILFEGEEISRYKKTLRLEERKRIAILDELANSTKYTHFYILKGGYYYRPNSCGYTSSKIEAGVYSKKEAIKSAKHCSEIHLIPVDIENHNQLVKDSIKKLQDNLINT